jgi:glycerophosphoryl diester phosphodiesterase
MTLVLTADGELVVRHTALANPVPISQVQLANWLRRQLRETV